MPTLFQSFQSFVSKFKYQSRNYFLGDMSIWKLSGKPPICCFKQISINELHHDVQTLSSCEYLYFVLNIFSHSETNLPHSNTTRIRGLITSMLIFLLPLLRRYQFCLYKHVRVEIAHRRHMLYLTHKLNTQFFEKKFPLCVYLKKTIKMFSISNKWFNLYNTLFSNVFTSSLQVLLAHWSQMAHTVFYTRVKHTVP